MAGQLDSLLKNVAKQVVADLGDSFDSSIVYTRKANRMTKSQIKSAVTRKRANPKGKVKTILKKGKK